MNNPTEDNIKIIFGLKVRKLRTQKGLTFQQLAEKTGISVSYLNEIENGKKYPKAEKISDLAKSLDTTYDNLVSLKLNKNLAPVAQFLKLDVINDFVFETFGIDKNLLLTMVANEPVRFSAFVNAIFEIARNYNLKQEHFFFSCLRSYQELNENYFEELEEQVNLFCSENNFHEKQGTRIAAYETVLKEKYNYTIKETDFANYPKLKNFRSIIIPNENKPTLLYNKKLTDQQKAFLFSREIGFCFLKINKRPYTTSWLTVDSFDHVLNNFKASYFATALHLLKDSFIKDLEVFFANKRFHADFIITLLQKYQASPEMILQRMTNLLPKFFGINELFFIRYSSKDADKNLKEISKELHLIKNAANISYTISEQSYRRWIAKSMLKYFLDNPSKATTRVEAVLSKNENDTTYFTLSVFREMPELNNKHNSVTIGWVVNENTLKKVQFLKDPGLSVTKLGDMQANKFETPLELKKMKEVEDREAEYKKISADILSQNNATNGNA